MCKNDVMVKVFFIYALNFMAKLHISRGILRFKIRHFKVNLWEKLIDFSINISQKEGKVSLFGTV